MIGAAGFMAAPKTTAPATLGHESWRVNNFNRKSTAHWWIDSTLNPGYARSQCGLVERKSNLQSPAHGLCRCERCNRGKMGAELAQTKKDVAQIKKLRSLGACNREIADALGIPEDSPILAR